MSQTLLAEQRLSRDLLAHNFSNLVVGQPLLLNNNGNFYSALPIKNFTAQGTYNSDTNNNNITQTHTQTHTHAHTHTHSHTHHHLRNTCHQNTHTKRLKIKPLALHLHSLSLSLPTCSYTGASHMQFYRRKSRVSS